MCEHRGIGAAACPHPRSWPDCCGTWCYSEMRPCHSSACSRRRPSTVGQGRLWMIRHYVRRRARSKPGYTRQTLVSDYARSALPQPGGESGIDSGAGGDEKYPCCLLFGWKGEERNRYRFFRHDNLILTSMKPETDFALDGRTTIAPEVGYSKVTFTMAAEPVAAPIVLLWGQLTRLVNSASGMSLNLTTINAALSLDAHRQHLQPGLPGKTV